MYTYEQCCILGTGNYLKILVFIKNIITRTCLLLLLFSTSKFRKSRIEGLIEYLLKINMNFYIILHICCFLMVTYICVMCVC